MKRYRLLFLFSLTFLLMAYGCDIKHLSPKEKPLIIVTIHPYELLVRELVDTLFTVETLLPANASPHTWSPGPQEIMKLDKADIVIANGLGLETNLDKILNKKADRLLTASRYIDKRLLMSEEEHGKEHSEDSHDNTNKGYNPHIWTAPDFLIDIIFGLSSDLGKRYPLLKDELDSRARLMVMEINRVDGKIKLERENYQNPAIITLHDAFVYFFRYFHIDYAGSVQPVAGKEPAPRQLKMLADAIRAKNIQAIFIEPQLNPKPAEILAGELGLEVRQYDNLGNASGAKNMAEFLWYNWNAIKAGF